MDFRNITMVDKKLFEGLEYMCSDYLFSYLFMYSEIYKLQIAENDNSIIIKSCDVKPFFYMPLGDVNHGIESILEYCRENKIKPIISKIPSSHLGYFDTSKFKVKEDRNSFDYIFRNSDLEAYEGKDFRKQRNNLSNYLKTFEARYTEDVLDHFVECKAFTLDHFTDADIYNPTLRMLENMKDFGCRGGIVWNGNTIQGFCIYEKVSPNTALSHVELTDNSHRGIHAYMINEMSKRIEDEFINKEDDMGLEGLRKFKESYNPCTMLKKYTAVLI